MSLLKRVGVLGVYIICLVLGTGLAAGNAWGGDREAVIKKVGEFIEAIGAGDEDTVKKLAAACCPLLIDMPGESLKTMGVYFGEIQDVKVDGDKAQAFVSGRGVSPNSGIVLYLQKIDGVWVISIIEGRKEGKKAPSPFGS